VAGRKEGKKENGGDVLAASDFEMKTGTKVNKILTVGLNYFVFGQKYSYTYYYI